MRAILSLRVLSAPILALCLIAPAAAQQRMPQHLQGFWDNAEDGCKSFHSEGRLIIKPNSIEPYESYCRVRSIASAGKNAWKIRARCGDIDGSSTQTLQWRLTPDGRLDDDTGGAPYRRCEPAPKP